MRATLLAELRDELAARRSAGIGDRGIRASHLALAATACAILIAVW
ncbi:MAG: hypothetical protein AAGF14_08810 [Pseudomonadota bacterium]